MLGSLSLAQGSGRMGLGDKGLRFRVRGLGFRASRLGFSSPLKCSRCIVL